MVNTFEAKVIQDFARDVAAKLSEAAVIAKMADGFGQLGLPDRAFKTLLGVETLIYDASILLNATSVVRRREHGGCMVNWSPASRRDRGSRSCGPAIMRLS